MLAMAARLPLRNGHGYPFLLGQEHPRPGQDQDDHHHNGDDHPGGEAGGHVIVDAQAVQGVLGVLDAQGVVGGGGELIPVVAHPGVDAHHDPVGIHQGAAGVAPVDVGGVLDHPAQGLLGADGHRVEEPGHRAIGDGSVVYRGQQIALIGVGVGQQGVTDGGHRVGQTQGVLTVLEGQGHPAGHRLRRAQDGHVVRLCLPLIDHRAGDGAAGVQFPGGTVVGVVVQEDVDPCDALLYDIYHAAGLSQVGISRHHMPVGDEHVRLLPLVANAEGAAH